MSHLDGEGSPPAGRIERSAARVPADHGLPCLGLLMQLAGNVFAALAVLVAFASLFEHRRGDDSLWLFLLYGASAARSLAHRAAGARLVYGDRVAAEQPDADEKRLAGVWRYIGVAVVHAALVFAIAIGHFDTSAGAALAIAGALLVWPAVLTAVITRAPIHALGRHLPASPDKGFEAVAIVMTVLATTGLALSLLLLGLVLDQPVELLQQGPALMAVVMLGALVARSGVHLQAGVAGLRETSIDRAVKLATRYADFGAISTFCGGAVLLLCVTIAQFDLSGLAIVVGLVWMLMAWPLIVRRFFSDRQFDDLLASDDANPHHRAPDAGLSGLGWLIGGTSAIALAWMWIGMAIGDNPPVWGMLPAIPGPGGPLALQVVVIALGGWAASELVRMTPRARVATIVWAVACAGVALVVVLPGVIAGFDIPSFARERYAGPMWWGGEIVLATAAVLLVTRRLAPAARARYRAARSTIAT